MTKSSPLGIATLVVGLCLLPACSSYIPFTTHLRNEFRLDDAALRKVQFYVSGNVVLRRDVSATETGRLSVGGVLRSAEGRLVEEILVKKHTPGIVLASIFEAEPPKAQLHVSFMPGDNTNYLIFAMPEGEQADSDAPFLLTPTLFEGQMPRVRYDNKLWSVDLRKQPRLMIRKAAFYKLKRIIRILPGRVVTP